MAATRQQRSSNRGRKSSRRAWLMPAVISSLMVLAGGGLWAGYHLLSQPGRLPLRVIEINGELQRLARDDIQRVVIDNIDGGFFSCDMKKLREAVVAMSWVDDVSVRRSWPDRLSMVVTEQVPLARWGDNALINVRGDVFRPESPGPFTSLVRLSGPQDSELRVVEFYQRVIAGTSARGMQLTEVELDQRRHWWLRFADGLTVSLGRENVDHRLAQFFRVFPSLVAQPTRQPERIDMRYANGFAVSWRETDNDESGGRELAVEEQA